MNFGSSEDLVRLFYVDLKFDDFTRSNSGKTTAELKKKLEELFQESSQLSLDEIKSNILSITEANEVWLTRFEENIARWFEIDPTNLCTDDLHFTIDSINTPQGTLLSSLLQQMNEDMRNRVDFIVNHAEVFEKLPIIVKKLSTNYEVWSGNHRVMAHISTGKKKIIALCIVD